MSTLRLYYGRDNHEMIRLLKQAQERAAPVSKLEVRETVLDAEVVEEIINLIASNPMETVQLDECSAYRNQETIRLVEALGGIKSLRLSEHTFLSQFFLVRLLVSATNLTNLRIQGHLEREQMLSLAEGLKENTSLHTLDLSRSRIVDFSALSDGLQQNSTLKNLKLRSIGLRDENVSELLQSLEEHPQLASIDLSFNRMLHMNHVGEFVENQNSVRELLLGYQNVWQAPKVSIARLTQALRAHEAPIKSISLARNKLDDEDAILLADVILDNSFIESINLSENRFTDVGVVALAKSLEETKSALEVSLLKNTIGAAGYAAILLAAKKNYDLFDVELTDDGGITRRIQRETALNKAGRKLLFLADPAPLSLWSIALARVSRIESLNEQDPRSFGKFCAADVIFKMLLSPSLFEGIVSQNFGQYHTR